MLLKTLAAAALLAAALPATAQAVDRPPMKSCGDMDAANGMLIGDVTARRVTCHNARRVARVVPTRCGTNTSSCTVRGFSCLVARAAPELRFARCTKPGEGDELFKTIRFDFGS
jgi:hypothetical protein